MLAPSPAVQRGLLEPVLACVRCRAGVVIIANKIRCEGCGAVYAITNGIPDLRPHTAADRAEDIAWSAHWSAENQDSSAQRFFSFYRKAVFARAVAYFVKRYLPHEGVLVEAGSGTSETSILVDKRGGALRLVALDLIRPVLERCQPVMDVCICGDIFSLPFQDGSLDGIWNVGVMEHFTQSEIDLILQEFRRVLKPGGRIVLLWPATFSIPQRILRVLEWLINLRQGSAKFRFHPDEISQLRSAAQGRAILKRNGFTTVAIDLGVRTLMAFETLIGEKVAL